MRVEYALLTGCWLAACAHAACPLAHSPWQVRDGVLYMLDAWIGVASSDKLFPAVADAVANPKCLTDGKVAGLQW